ncbi:MAG: 50S ribosomal protein L35 [Clostridia bacterium]|nr:50S ribosomal protein L35 [Oscillospiraceae bacterium]MBO5037079.1 50S ribosomal protein L35 [Clostridia bacterium]MBO5299006.1 50S ribosomal protein L35 [Clostridia bacterium]MBQ2719949.1 50S ribosomal protein L35 [Clostridia bacterium]MBQ4627546.1 50S ribosomal protein L35 [Clostridia bacterium]
MANKIKLKSHRGAAKRFTVLKSGKVKINHANRRHILTKKTTKYKRGLRKGTYASPANAPTIKKLLPY